MFYKDQEITITYYAITADGIRITELVANHTLRIITDGVSAAPTNTPVALVDANCKGMYNLVITAAENTGDLMIVTGESSTVDIEIVPFYWNNSDELLTSAEVNAACDQSLADYDGPTNAELTAIIGGLNDLSSAEAETACDASLATYDGPTNAELTALISSLNDITVADIMDSTLEGALTLTHSIRVMLSVLLGNRTESSGTYTFRNQADTGDRVVASVSGENRTVTTVDGA